MSDFDLSQFDNVDPAQFAQLVKSASDAQLNEVMTSDHRPKILE